MPRGGARVGAGRKPGQKKVKVLGFRNPNQPAWTPTAPSAPSVDAAVADPPADLGESAKVFWREWAPHAIEQGTLTEAQVAGFRELCEQLVVKRALWDRMETLGPASAEADRILKRYEKMAQRVDASLARFRLTSFGKPMGEAKPRKPAANPWASIVGG